MLSAAQRFHGERVEARQAERNPDIFNRLDQAHRASQGDRSVADFLATLVIGAALDDALGLGRRTPRFAGMEGIRSAIDHAPDSPFMKFWAALNDARDAEGNDELLYREAKLAYTGGKTPEGAMTFIGKSGVRAVPSRLLTSQGRSAYHGEFSEIAEHGATVWRVVANKHGHPIEYGTVESALKAALDGQAHMAAQKS